MSQESDCLNVLPPFCFDIATWLNFPIGHSDHSIEIKRGLYLSGAIEALFLKRRKELAAFVLAWRIGELNK